MKKIVFLLIGLFYLLSGTVAQGNVAERFVAMPDSLLPLLATNDRLDLIDFHNAKMRAVVTNKLDGKSELVALSDDYLKIKTSCSATMQMKLLTRSDGDTLVCIVNTVCAEACNSYIRFYDKEWKRVSTAPLFVAPSLDEFFQKKDSVSVAMKMSDIRLVSISLSAGCDTLSTNYTMPLYMPHDDSLFVASRLQSVMYRWDGYRYVKLQPGN